MYQGNTRLKTLGKQRLELKRNAWSVGDLSCGEKTRAPSQERVPPERYTHRQTGGGRYSESRWPLNI